MKNLDIKVVQIFDVLFLDKIDNTIKNESINFLDEFHNIELIGLCIIPPHVMMDGKARFMSFAEGKELTWCKNNKANIFREDKGWYDEDGLFNTKIILEENTDEDYEAASWCKSLKNYENTLKWYLPAIGELRFLIASIKRINLILKELGYNQIDTSEGYGTWYWSSSEYNSSNARYVSCNFGDVNTNAKSSTNTRNRVRAFLSL